MVLFDAAVFHLVEAEDAFQYAQGCSTFALTRDLVVFFLLATSSEITQTRRGHTKAHSLRKRPNRGLPVEEESRENGFPISSFTLLHVTDSTEIDVSQDRERSGDGRRDNQSTEAHIVSVGRSRQNMRRLRRRVRYFSPHLCDSFGKPRDPD